MICDGDCFILDSKYYKFGITKNKAHLPGAESVCKQMAYAEFVEKEFAFTSGHIYNAFIMPYCESDETTTGLATSGMRFAGLIYGDWKDCSKSYRKIACILLDVKTVMQNYETSSGAQEELAKLILR